MNPILLHIGSTKTGTSSLQQFFTQRARALAGQGVVYPMAGRRAPGQIAHHNLCYEKQEGRIANGVFKPAVGVWSEALDEIDRAPGSIGVISSEAFMNCRPQQVPRFRDELAGRDVKVIAYVRRQDLWLQSAWNQQARFGRCSLDFHDFYTRIRERGRGDYHRQLEPWAAAFGPSNIFVRNFDSLSSDGIVPDFVATFLPGVLVDDTRQDDARRNTKAGVKQLLAVAMVLEACRERFGSDFELPSTSAIRIAEYFRDRPGEVTKYAVLTYEDASEIHRAYAPSNARLAQLSPSFSDSGGFPAPDPADYRDRVDFAALGQDILSDEERRFVIRMIREVSRVSTSRRFWSR